MTSRAHSPMTPDQLRKIWVSARELGWDEDRLHQHLDEVIGAASLRTLTREEAGLFIQYMIGEGATPGDYRPYSYKQTEQPAGASAANVIPLASPAQQHLVDELLRLVGWTRETPYFLGCLKKGIGHTRIRTRREAQVAITILNKTLARRQSEQEHASTPGDWRRGA